MNTDFSVEQPLLEGKKDTYKQGKIIGSGLLDGHHSDPCFDVSKLIYSVLVALLDSILAPANFQLTRAAM